MMMEKSVVDTTLTGYDRKAEPQPARRLSRALSFGWAAILRQSYSVILCVLFIQLIEEYAPSNVSSRKNYYAKRPAAFNPLPDCFVQYGILSSFINIRSYPEDYLGIARVQFRVVDIDTPEAFSFLRIHHRVGKCFASHKLLLVNLKCFQILLPCELRGWPFGPRAKYTSQVLYAAHYSRIVEIHIRCSQRPGPANRLFPVALECQRHLVQRRSSS